MSTNLFFPDNRGRYNRVMQLSNNIGAIKALSAKSYDTMKQEAEEIDTLCKDLMKQHGAKTLKEYAESIANTLPDDEKNRVLNLLKALDDTDVFLTNASAVLGGVLGAAGGLRFASGSTKMLIEILSEGIFRAEFARGFRLFVRGELREGTRVMRGVARWARNHYEYLGELAPAARSARAVRVLKVFNSVLEFVAKWAFVLDIAVLFIQFEVEQEQRTQLRSAIHDFFCQRFSVQMQFDQFTATSGLYTQLRGFVQTKSILEKTAMPQTAKDEAVTALGDGFMNTYNDNMAKITDDKIWQECEDYDKLDTEVYKADDPDLAEVKRFLEEQSKKNPEDIKDKTTSS
ncbi:hypothetical protein KHU50_009524 [Colletotrichum sp. SAR 10_65]|nr:hypothetical protein KHU50_009524 [Colletotrichum sp. SAR 10_65]